MLMRALHCVCSAVRGLSNYLMIANSRCVFKRLRAFYCPMGTHTPSISLSISLLAIDSKDKQLQNAMKAQQQQNAKDNGPAQAEFREL